MIDLFIFDVLVVFERKYYLDFGVFLIVRDIIILYYFNIEMIYFINWIRLFI